ncbi:MAG: helix-turn-helix transcriptional regulator [Rickettsiales bacterium]
MNIETIVHDGKKLAVIPINELKKLLSDSEALADIRAYDIAKARLEDGDDEVIPFELSEARVNGENMLKKWRQYRKLTQENLAIESGVSRAMIASIEAGHKNGSVATMKKLAKALNVSLEQTV